MSRTALAATLLVLLLGVPAAFAAPGYTLRAVAIEGDPAPGTGDLYGSFDFQDVVVNASGEVAFGVPLTPPVPPPSGQVPVGLFVDSGGGPVLRIRNGELPPVAGFDEYRLFGSYVGLDGGGRLATSSILVDLEMVEGEETVVGTAHGLFEDDAGTDGVLVVEGDTAPAPPAGTLDAGLVETNYFGANAAGDLAFESTVTGGSASPGLFVRSAGGSISLRSAAGDAPSGAGTHTLSGFDYPAINSGGDLSFVGLLTGGTSDQGLFLDGGSGPVTLALRGDAAPGTGGATFDGFFAPALNASGHVVFMAPTVGGTALGGLFQATPAVAPVLVDGGAVPGAGTVSMLTSLPEIASDGSMAMSLGFGSGPVSAGVFLRKASGSYEPVALAFEDAPDSGGAFFSTFGWLGMNDAGEIAFISTLDDGRSAIYLATPTPAAVPLLPAPLAAVLALLLVGTGIASRRSTGADRA